VARAIGSKRLHWLNVLAVTAATTYVAVSALGIAAQQVMVESTEAGIDAKTVLNVYILDSEAFTMSFEILALFAIALGSVIFAGTFAMPAIGGAAILVGAVLFITDGGVSVLFMIRPPQMSRAA
jgi:hypothetical protein